MSGLRQTVNNDKIYSKYCNREKLKLFEEQDAIALVTTQWHLMGVFSYLIGKHGNLNNIKIAIIIMPHPINGYLFDLKNFQDDSNILIIKRCDVKQNSLRYFKLPFFLMNTIIPIKKDIEFIIPRNISVNMLLNIINIRMLLNKKLRIICVDEGIGTYFSKEVWKRCSESEGGYGLFTAIKSNVSQWLKNIMNVTEWNLMDKSDTLVANEEVVSNYRKAIELIAKNSYKEVLSDVTELLSFKKVAILVSQPWTETGQFLLEEEVEIISKTILYLSVHNYEVFIKLHPRDEMEKYKKVEICNSKILSGNVPIEVIFSCLRKDDIVVGYSSTALITAKVVFGIEAFTILDRLDYKDKENMMSQSFEEFMVLCKNLVRPLGGE